MVTTTLPAAVGPRVSAAQAMQQIFQGQAAVVERAEPAMADPATLKPDAKSASAVISACSMPSLADTFGRCVDQEGRQQAGRFISMLPRYTVLGGGVHALKHAGSGTTASELVGVVVRLKPYRVLYGRKIDEERSAPSCASINLQTGKGDPGRACQGCPQTAYINRDTPWCRQKSRLYIVLRDTAALSVIDLTAMSREGLDDYLGWSRLYGRDCTDFVVKLTLSRHPRSPETGNNQTSLLHIRPVAVANDGTDEYREAVAFANMVLTQAEGAWLDDIAQPMAGGGDPAAIGDGATPQTAIAGAPPMPAHDALPDYPPEPPPPDFDDSYGDPDDLPF